MNEISEQLLTRPTREGWFSRFQVLALAAITLIAIIGKVYLPRLIPNTEWLRDSGVATDDGVVCDEFCRAADGVYAAGDVAQWRAYVAGDSSRDAPATWRG